MFIQYTNWVEIYLDDKCVFSGAEINDNFFGWLGLKFGFNYDIKKIERCIE